jgi:hypothetical protein
MICKARDGRLVLSNVKFGGEATVFLDKPPPSEVVPSHRHFSRLDDAIRFVKEQADPSLIVEVYSVEGARLTMGEIDARYSQLINDGLVKPGPKRLKVRTRRSA